MANRSKKVVLSARVDPYLKAGLELLAEARNEKIVKILETFIENGLHDMRVINPLQPGEKGFFLPILTAIWSNDEVLFKLRAGAMGPEFAGYRTWRIAMVVIGDPMFEGVYDLFGDLNGAAERYGWRPPIRQDINIDKVREEWKTLGEYVDFIENNKPIEPTYREYKHMLASWHRKRKEAGLE